MQNLPLSERVKVSRVLNAVAAGTTAQNGTAVDMQGYDGVMFVAMFGTLTANQVTSLKAQQSSDNGSADTFADLEETGVGPLVDGDGNKCLILDVFCPEERYVRPVVSRGTANAVIDGVIAIQYSARERPTAHAASVAAAATLVRPDEGTA